MRCPECDYPLWNLKARECPECGRAFRPSEFEFVPNSVRFCCPKCDQAYFGTGARGHLVPSEFDCVQCSARLSMDDTVLRPAEGVADEQTQVDRLPWLERQRKGLLRSWIRTIGLALVAPHRLARGLPGQPRPASGWWYLFLTWTVFGLGGAALPLFGIALVEALSGDLSDAAELSLVASGIAIGGGIAIVVAVLLWGLVTHGMLRMTGGAAYGIGRTFESLCYTGGAGAIFIIPCLGPYCGSVVGGVWWIVSAILAVAMAQRLHGGRASLAVLTLPVIVGVLGMAAYLGLFLYVLPNAATGFTTAASQARTMVDLTQVTQSVIAAGADDGVGPDHGVRLLESAGAGPTLFVLGSTATTPDSIPAGDTNILDLSMLPPTRRRAAIDAIAAGLPPNVVAHRVGDMVFTYHGMDLTDPEAAGLWVLVATPDPAGGGFQFGNLIGAGLADGSVQVFGIDELPRRLIAQNAKRVAAGLPPLPDPTMVTNVNPAAN